MKSKFKVGDKVRVVNVEKFYPAFDSMIEFYGFKNYEENMPPQYNKEYIVLQNFIHPNMQDNIPISIIGDEKNEFVIGQDGLELIGEPRLFTFEDR